MAAFRVNRGIWLVYRVEPRFLAPLEMTILAEAGQLKDGFLRTPPQILL